MNRNPNALAALEDFHPSDKEQLVLARLSENTSGLQNKQLKGLTRLTDPTLANCLWRLGYYGLITRDYDRRYLLTDLGLACMSHSNPVSIPVRESTLTLWNEVQRLHKKVSLLKKFGGRPDLMFVGALRSKDGKKRLIIKTPSLKELANLGYLKQPRPEGYIWRTLPGAEVEEAFRKGKGLIRAGPISRQIQ